MSLKSGRSQRSIACATHDIIASYINSRGLKQGVTLVKVPTTAKTAITYVSWKDIPQNKLHIVDLANGTESLRTIDTGVAVSVTADIEGRSDVILTGAKDGITKLNLETGKHTYITRLWAENEGPEKVQRRSREGPEKVQRRSREGPEKVRRMRSNDGAVDSAGRFWVGTMNDPKEAEITNEAVLFRLDTDGSLHRILEKVTVPNGIIWNDRDDTMYWTDTPTNNVYAFDFDAQTGKISNQRAFYHHHQDDEHSGAPDGHARNINGDIWYACYDGSKIIKISPEGKLIGEIALATRNPICPVFVGTELFITSAKEDEPAKYPESATYAGAIFRVDVGVEGMPKHKARIP